LLIEFLDNDSQWRPFDNATAVCVEAGVYEITISELSHLWRVQVDLFDGTLLRIDGRETKSVAGVRRERDRIVLRATV
jgi:hypothetical protein